jgi:GAF domain-containing protein
MPMRATTVRFAESLWTLVEQEAEREGVSAAQFIRDASVMRAAYAMGRRGDPDVEAVFGHLGGASEAESTGNGAARRRALLAAAAAVRDPERLRALQATGLLDSEADPAFDRHARLAASVLNAPIALVSLVDADRQFFKSCFGLPEPWASQRETPLSYSFCQHAVASREPLIVEDAREHEVLRENLAVRDMGLVAYAGIPLMEPGGTALGTLCVLDSEPREWSSRQVELLKDLAANVVTEITLAREARG